jgi:hypothetical protein
MVATREGIKIIERPVELIELRPPEIAVSGLVVFALPEQELARRQKSFQSLAPMHIRRFNMADRHKQPS